MGERAPFSAEERREIERAARAIIYGERIVADTAPAVKKYGVLVRSFILYANRDNGSLNWTPYGGGFLEQPYKTSEALEVIQHIFCQKLSDEIKKANRRG